MNLRTAFAVSTLVAVAVGTAHAQRKHTNAIIDLWAAGKPALGVYVPFEGQPMPSDPAPAGQRGPGAFPPAAGAPGQRGPATARPVPRYTKAIGETLAKNPLYDYVFLNLEEEFHMDAVTAIMEGIRTPAATSRKSVIVRIPSIADAGSELTRYRVKAIFDAGADAVTIPHVEGLDQAKEAISFFTAATKDIWTPDNPAGEKLAMIMIEDPQTLTIAKEIADLKGYSVLACGVGSLGGAFRQHGIANGLVSLGLLQRDVIPTLGELGTQKVLAETKRTRLANMITANAGNLQQRVKDGFQALLFAGPGSDDLIRTARSLTGR